MSEEFLYRLRVQPRDRFATALKNRLDLQEASARARKWPYIVGALLVCAGAAAFFSKSLWESPAKEVVVSAPPKPPQQKTLVVAPVVSVPSPAPSAQKPVSVPVRPFAEILADMQKDLPRPPPGEAAALPLSAEPLREGAPPAWLLTCRGDDSVVLRFTATGAEEILSAGRIILYGTSAAGDMAFITRALAGGNTKLHIVDMSARKVSRSLSIPGQPAEWMIGALNNVVLTERFAYYISLRYAGNELVENDKGGLADLQRVDLRSGEARAFPLPRDVVEVRLLDFGGVPLLYSGYNVWKLDEKTEELKPLATKADVPDVVRWKIAAEHQRSPLNFSDMVAIEGTGIFLLSRVGALQHLLDANLELIAAPRLAVQAGAPEALRGIFHGTLDGRPLIGVIEEGKEQTTLTYRDPLSLRSEWKVVLPPGAEIHSLHPSVGNAVYYIDSVKATLNRITGERVQPAWKLDADVVARRCQPRILRIDVG